jgi:hypothetical protein
MFAMTSLVGTRVVAAPKATRAVRSTTTVAAAGKKAPAKKKVRTLTNFREHISIRTRRPRRASRGAVANARAARADDPSRSSRRGSDADRADALGTARTASPRKGGCSG